MNAHLSSLRGPLGKYVLHALQSVLDPTALPGATCDGCERLYAERLPEVAVTWLMPSGKPTGVVVHLCERCRAELDQSWGAA